MQESRIGAGQSVPARRELRAGGILVLRGRWRPVGKGRSSRSTGWRELRASGISEGKLATVQSA